MTITADPTSPAAAGPRPSGPLRAVIVDDHQLLAESLSMALHLEGVVCTVASLQDPEALVRQVRQDQPDLVLLDLDLGGNIGDGADLVVPFVEAGCRVLVCSASVDPERTALALELGAVGLVHKSVPFERLLATAVAAARGEAVMDAAERRRLLDEARARRRARGTSLAPFERLSVRESHVLRGLAAGQSVAAISATSYVSEATVRSQVRAVLTKLGVGSQLEAVAAAHRTGWL